MVRYCTFLGTVALGYTQRHTNTGTCARDTHDIVNQYNNRNKIKPQIKVNVNRIQKGIHKLNEFPVSQSDGTKHLPVFLHDDATS